MSKIKLVSGMAVKCLVGGKGKIVKIHQDEEYCIELSLDNGKEFGYLKDGSNGYSLNPTLKLLNIPFTEGLEVECDIYGSGKVNRIYESTAKYPVYVIFETGDEIVYTLDGRISQNANQTLFPKFTI